MCPMDKELGTAGRVKGTRKNKYKGSKASDWPPSIPKRAREALIGDKSRAKEGKPIKKRAWR